MGEVEGPAAIPAGWRGRAQALLAPRRLSGCRAAQDVHRSVAWPVGPEALSCTSKLSTTPMRCRATSSARVIWLCRPPRFCGQRAGTPAPGCHAHVLVVLPPALGSRHWPWVGHAWKGTDSHHESSSSWGNRDGARSLANYSSCRCLGSGSSHPLYAILAVDRSL